MSNSSRSKILANPLFSQALIGLWVALVTFCFSSYQAKAEALRVARKEKVETIKSFSEDADTAVTMLLNLSYRRALADSPPIDDPFRRSREQYYSEYLSFVQQYRDKPKILGLVTRVRSTFRSSKVLKSASKLRETMLVLESPPYPDKKRIIDLQKSATDLIAKTIEAMGEEVDNDQSVPRFWQIF